jgi:hypothetical protein
MIAQKMSVGEAAKTQNLYQSFMARLTYPDSNSCTPYDTVVNPSFNYYFANWTVTTDPQPPPDQAGQLYIVTGQGYPDGQVYNDGDWTEYTEVSLRVAEWNPTVTTDDGDVSAQLVQWVPVCSDTSYYFQIAFDSGSSVITSGDCSLGLLLGSDPESEVWSDWTDITGYEASGPLLSSNTYTTGDDEVAIPITIDLYCSPEANFEDGNIRVHVDSVSLQVDE